MAINNEKVAPLSHNFLPQHLKRKPLYVEFTELLDYLTHKCYEPHVINMRDKLNPLGSGFDPDEFLNFIDGFKYKDLIFKDVDIRTVATLLPRIYTLKGTKKGLIMLLNILGIKADIYIWWEILRKYGVDQEYTKQFNSKFGSLDSLELEECSIYLNLLDNGTSLNGYLGADIDERLKELCTAFLWVCSYINVINIARGFITNIQTSDLFAHTSESCNYQTFFDSYFYRYGLNSNSNIIYNGQRKHNEPNLFYGSTTENSLVLGYDWLATEQKFTSVGSILDASEHYYFSDNLNVRSRISNDQTLVDFTNNQGTSDVISIEDTSDILRTNVGTTDTLSLLTQIPFKDGKSGVKLVYVGSQHKPTHIHPDERSITYINPVTDTLTLSDTFTHTIEED